MSTDVCPVKQRQEWLAARMSGIGASESAAVLGVDPWKSAFQLWSEKTGLAESEDLSDNESVEFGKRLELPIIEAYADRTGRTADPWSQTNTVQHPQYPFMRCTPDAIQQTEEKGLGILQVKTTHAFSKEWKDEAPLHYVVQAMHEMAVMDCQWGTLCVLIGGQRLKWFDLDRNQRFIDNLIRKLEQFWNLVQTKTPPPVDGSVATAKVLMKLHPDDSGDEIWLPDEAAQWTEEIAAAKKAIDEAEERKTLAENKIKAILADATFGILPDGRRWSWKTQEKKSYTVRASKTRVLRQLKPERDER